MSPTNVEGHPEERIARIETLLRRGLSADPKTALKEALELRNAIVDEFARRLSPAINQLMHAGRLDSHKAKRGAAKALTVLLREFGLCLKCPKTGEATVLIGSARDNQLGRFQFMTHRRSDHVKQIRTLSSVTLPDLELRPEPTTDLRNALSLICGIPIGTCGRDR